MPGSDRPQLIHTRVSVAAEALLVLRVLLPVAHTSCVHVCVYAPKHVGPS